MKYILRLLMLTTGTGNANFSRMSDAGERPRGVYTFTTRLSSQCILRGDGYNNEIKHYSLEEDPPRAVCLLTGLKKVCHTFFCCHGPRARGPIELDSRDAD